MSESPREVLIFTDALVSVDVFEDRIELMVSNDEGSEREFSYSRHVKGIVDMTPSLAHVSKYADVVAERDLALWLLAESEYRGGAAARRITAKVAEVWKLQDEVSQLRSERNVCDHNKPRLFRKGDDIPDDVLAVRDHDGDVWERRAAWASWHSSGLGAATSPELLFELGPVTEVRDA